MTPLSIQLRNLRVAAGLSQTALADLAGVRQAAISALETGKAKRVDFVTMERLARALKVEPHQLFVTVPPPRGGK